MFETNEVKLKVRKLVKTNTRPFSREKKSEFSLFYILIHQIKVPIAVKMLFLKLS